MNSVIISKSKLTQIILTSYQAGFNQCVENSLIDHSQGLITIGSMADGKDKKYFAINDGEMTFEEAPWIGSELIDSYDATDKDGLNKIIGFLNDISGQLCDFSDEEKEEIEEVKKSLRDRPKDTSFIHKNP